MSRPSADDGNAVREAALARWREFSGAMRASRTTAGTDRTATTDADTGPMPTSLSGSIDATSYDNDTDDVVVETAPTTTVAVATAPPSAMMMSVDTSSGDVASLTATATTAATGQPATIMAALSAGRLSPIDETIERLRLRGLPASPDGEGVYYVYTLRLANDKWYVGMTDALYDRLEAHMDGRGCHWTRTHCPYDLVDLRHGNGGDELLMTLRMMAEYGIENVRGSCFAPRDTIDAYMTRQISTLVRAMANRCYRCGGDHLMKACDKTRHIPIRPGTRFTRPVALRVLPSLVNQRATSPPPPTPPPLPRAPLYGEMGYLPSRSTGELPPPPDTTTAATVAPEDVSRSGGIRGLLDRAARTVWSFFSR